MVGIQFEDSCCGSCGSQEYDILYSAPEHSCYSNCNIVKCEGCGLVRTNPRPTFSTLFEAYTNDYYSRETPHVEKFSDKWKVFALKHKLKILYPYIIPYDFLDSDVRICDVGCGSGHWLKLMRSAHPKAVLYGFEIDLPTAEIVEKTTGAQMHYGNFLDNNWPSEHFDFITFWDVLEHTHNPKEVLSEVKRLLKPNGHVIVSVPNFECIHSKFFKQFWLALAFDAHLYHFSAVTLTTMLESCSLSPTHVTTNTLINPVLRFSLQNWIKEIRFKEQNRISEGILGVFSQIASVLDKSQLSRLLSDHLIVHAQKSHF
jgi:2-polyprenyl-3-methyl-5-hydroxy-6-metoxy-1,4-benzoquinol methylase